MNKIKVAYNAKRKFSALEAERERERIVEQVNSHLKIIYSSV